MGAGDVEERCQRHAKWARQYAEHTKLSWWPEARAGAAAGGGGRIGRREWTTPERMMNSKLSETNGSLAIITPTPLTQTHTEHT